MLAKMSIACKRFTVAFLFGLAVLVASIQLPTIAYAVDEGKIIHQYHSLQECESKLAYYERRFDYRSLRCEKYHKVWVLTYA